MKILHLESSPGWGGQEIRILREAEEMRQRGHEVVLGVMKGGELINKGCKAGFTVESLNFNKSHWLLCLIQILSMIYRYQIDLINTHSSLDAWIGGIASRIARKPILRTRHLSTPIRAGWNSKILYGILADFVVTTCASIVPMICTQSGRRISECRSIPTGVDPKRIHCSEEDSKKARAHFKIRDTDFLIGTACFIRSWKGIVDFLKAANILRNVQDIKWIVIGGGHEKAYREIASNWHLNEVVYFTGHLENPFPILGGLDLFALLSTAHEGVSQALLQAAYLEKPLISTRIGGLTEVCLDRVTGIQVEPFAPDQVARVVLELKNNPSLRRELGRNGKNLVKEKFTLSQTIDQMEQAYAQIMKRST